MRYHVCTHYGDIEINALPAEDGQARCKVTFWRLTTQERTALERLLSQHTLERKGEGEGATKAERILPLSAADAGLALSKLLHGEDAILLTGVKFAGGKVKVARKDREVKALLQPADNGDDGGKPEAAVTVEKPYKGCPMPTTTELREQRAAAVVRTFLLDRQREDFDRRRAFLSIGCDTGALYRITSRWSPDCERYGALSRIDGGPVCASNLSVPPSEEMLSLKFAVESMERDFLSHHD